MIETLYNGVRAVILKHEGVVVQQPLETETVTPRSLMPGIIPLLHRQYERGLINGILATSTGLDDVESEVHFARKMIDRIDARVSMNPRSRGQVFSDFLTYLAKQEEIRRSEVLFIGNALDDQTIAEASRVRFVALESEENAEHFRTNGIPTVTSLDELQP